MSFKSSRKRNEWLGVDDSDAEVENTLHSEVTEDSRSRRVSKRRRVSRSNEPSSSSDAEEPQPKGTNGIENFTRDGLEEVLDLSSVSRQDRSKVPEPTNVASVRNILSKTLTAHSKSSKTGVIYLSRVPPFMKPQTVKHLLEPYGDIGRIFLTPEDPMSHSQRVRSGGNKKRSFTDGWVEFKNKSDAKLVAETLNAQIIGGKKGGWYHDDIWNIKYLTGFKWQHLTEQIANENAERAARLRTEIAQTTKENKRFVENVERAKMLENMEAKKKRYNSTLVGSDEAVDRKGHGNSDHGRELFKATSAETRNFRQNEVRSITRTSHATAEQSEEVRRVLAKIF